MTEPVRRKKIKKIKDFLLCLDCFGKNTCCILIKLVFLTVAGKVSVIVRNLRVFSISAVETSRGLVWKGLKYWVVRLVVSRKSLWIGLSARNL